MRRKRIKQANPISYRELYLFTMNDGIVYNRIRKPIEKNLEKKAHKGIYYAPKAVIAFKRVADIGAKRYEQEFGGRNIFSVADRIAVAKRMERDFRAEMRMHKVR